MIRVAAAVVAGLELGASGTATASRDPTSAELMILTAEATAYIDQAKDYCGHLGLRATVVSIRISMGRRAMGPPWRFISKQLGGRCAGARGARASSGPK